MEFDRIIRLNAKNPSLFYALSDMQGRLLSFDYSKATLLGLDRDSLQLQPIVRTLLPSLAKPGMEVTLQRKQFPRTEHYPHAMRSVLWDVDLDAASGTALLQGMAIDVLDQTDNVLEQLTERVRRHDRLLENLPGMVYRCRIDKAWTMEFVSGADPLTGYHSDQLLSGEISWGDDLIVPEDRQRAWDTVMQAIESHKPFELDYQIETRTGKIKTMWERGMAIFDEAGSAIALEGFITDMTPLLKAQSDLRTTNTHLRNLLNSATETAFIMTDTVGTITMFSKGAENLMGYRAEELVNKKTPIDFHVRAEIEQHGQWLTEYLGEPITGFEVFVALARRGFHDRHDWTFVRQDGSTFPVELIVTAVRDDDDRIVGFLGVAEDMSERLEAQQQLHEAKERAEASNHAKDEFLAVISHEMRTPLNPILGFSNMLLQEEPDAEDREALEIIQRSAQKLLRQIEDILGFIGIDKRKTKVELCPCPLWNFTLSAARDLEALVQGNQFYQINGCSKADTVDGNLYVMMDPQLTWQILNNLITNAFKFTLQGEVTLRVGWREDVTGGIARFEVSDTGIGIAMDKQQSIFEPFTQVESNYTRRYEGVGLGLAICAKLIDVLGGQIGFESELGRGSRFWVELPAEAVERGTDTDSFVDYNAAAFAQTRILVVEDNPDNRAMLVNYLRKIGADVMTANDGLSAIERCRQYTFHFVLMDISMPGMDGFEAAASILALSSESPKIVAVTAHASEDVRQRCRETGMIEFMPKPVTLDALRSMLELHQSVF